MSKKNSTDLYENAFIINYEEGDRSLQRRSIVHQEDIGDQYHVVRLTDTITSISYKYYSKPLYWYLIADVNEIVNPLDLELGQTLIIPNLDRYELL